MIKIRINRKFKILASDLFISEILMKILLLYIEFYIYIFFNKIAILRKFGYFEEKIKRKK